MRLCMLSLLLAASSLLSAQSGTPVKDSAEAKARLQAFGQHQALVKTSRFKDLKWTFTGPVAATGRMPDVAAHPDRPGTIFVVAASGGAFKTTDDGGSWTPIFDNQPTACMGDISVAPSNPDVVWIGTGEANILRSSMAGTGVYKSTDGGKTFQHMGLTDTQHIARIVIHPTNPDIVYVAAPGREWNFGNERGLYKTTDGGKTWTKVFHQDEKTGVIEVVMDPTNPDTLYAGTADRRRYRWNDPLPSFRSGIHKSTDGGKTWKPLTKGLPDFAKGEHERVGLDLCASHPKVVYAVLNKAKDADAKKVGAHLYRSEDGGETWTETEGNASIRGVFSDYGWYFGQVRADPVDPMTVYVMGLGFKRSKDGGKTWESLKGNHTDYHGAWINPKDPKHILAVNDGGLMISKDGFATFKHPDNVPIPQLYNVSLTQTPGSFWMYSTRQDMGGWRGQATVNADRSITWSNWSSGPGDESGRHAVDPTNPDLVYHVTRYGGGPFQADYTKPNPRNQKPPLNTNLGAKLGFEPRAQWVSPLILSPHSPKRLLYGCQYVCLSDDQGQTWRRISPDLTDYDPAHQGNINFATLFALSESPLKKGLIYAGTDDGLAHVTRNEGATWTKISAGLPAQRFISSLAASKFQEGRVYLTVNGKRNDEFKTLLYGSTDYGKAWKLLTPTLPGSNANVVKEDPTNGNILYLGTDQGVYVSLDRGAKWEALGAGLPATLYVHDLAIQEKEDVLVAATHGRGTFILDLRPLRKAAKQ